MADKSNFDADQRKLWLSLYEQMMLIRRSEERLADECKAGTLPGGVHLSIGQEASCVGVCSVLEDADYVTSTHRGHGHFLAKGGDLNAMFAEIWGKKTGICQGMGGSMHVADVSKGMLGANGIVGGGLAIATGAALGQKLDGNKKVSVCIFGDGAANQGVFMESMNVSSIWKLPTVFFCENNGLSEFTISDQVTAGKLSDRARAFGMDVQVVDGNDLIAVREAVQKAVDMAREGNGPCYVEVDTYRIRGHLEAEDLFLGGKKYREKEEIEAWQTKEKDPVLRFAKRLLDEAGATQADLDEIEERVMAQVEEAVTFATESEEADTQLPHKLMFVDQPA